MGYLKQQKGYALILVLLIITIIGLFLPLLMSNILSSSHQYEKTEKMIQLEKISEMGVIYVERAIDLASEQARLNTLSWIESQEESVPDTSEIINQYKSFLITSLTYYNLDSEFEMIFDEESYRYKAIINLIDNGTNLKVKYTITSSIDREYQETNTREEERIIALNISD